MTETTTVPKGIPGFDGKISNDILLAFKAYGRNPLLQATDLADMYGWSYMHSKRISDMARFSIWMQGGPPPKWASGSYAAEYLNELARLAEYISLHPYELIDNIAEEMGYGISKINRMVKNLKIAGILSRSGSARKGTWVVHTSLPVRAVKRANEMQKEFCRGIVQ